jgi:hypothetical protein
LADEPESPEDFESFEDESLLDEESLFDESPPESDAFFLPRP